MSPEIIFAFVAGFLAGGFVGIRVSVRVYREAMDRGRMFFKGRRGKWYPSYPFIDPDYTPPERVKELEEDNEE